MSMKPPTPLSCPSCGALTEIGDRFCGDCGETISKLFEKSSNPCSCGSENFDIDGYCVDCGAKQRKQLGEMIINANFAAITDIGCTHDRNDDAFNIVEYEGNSAIVICDGVSKSQTPDVGAVASVNAACKILEEYLKNEICTPEEIIKIAIETAHTTMCLIPYDTQIDLDPPAATIVVALIRKIDNKNLITVGWLGDSRIYWITSNGGSLLTRDHSWRNAMVDSGLMTDEEAKKDKQSHAIVKCLGTNDIGKITPCPEPSIKTYAMNTEGWLISCTDGLWNYAETPSQLTTAANGTLWTSNAIDIARRLVLFAKNRGGHDNITIALRKIT